MQTRGSAVPTALSPPSPAFGVLPCDLPASLTPSRSLCYISHDSRSYRIDGSWASCAVPIVPAGVSWKGRVVWKRDPDLVKGFVPTELWRFIEQIASPTIYILGSDSTIVPPEAQERLTQTIPDVEIVVLPGVGHYPHLETPAEYLAEIDRFLARRPSRPREP